MELLSSSPMRSFSRLLSNVRTCSRSTMESFASPQEAALSEICVGSLDLSFWLVIAAAITVGLVSNVVLNYQHWAHSALL